MPDGMVATPRIAPAATPTTSRNQILRTRDRARDPDRERNRDRNRDRDRNRAIRLPLATA
ncbi:hypothetical protein GCM10027280_25930 [Micromonospora polyrhachis]